MRLLLMLCLLYPSACYAQTAAELKGYVEYFTADGREDGSAHIKKSQDYIVGLCNSWGYKTERQPVYGCNNILAWKLGTEPGVVVVGAHLDTFRDRPGADDNASGSAMVLGLAHKYARIKPKYTMLFAFWTKEEDGLIGSKHYVKNPKWFIRDHIFNLNLDMVGRLSQKYAKVPGIEVNPIIQKLGPRYLFAKNITYTELSGSDHVSFARVGIPIIALHTGLHKDYHRVSDTPEKINYKGMELISEYAFAILNEIVPAGGLDYVFYNLPELEVR
jgi:Iap family predicted aminopeptidase